jgi:dTDP-4-dehydrorhamnose reductase
LDEGHQTLKENDVKAIVNCAAWTNVDACETDEKLAALAEKLNAEAPENLAKAMKEVDLHTHLIWLMPLSPYWIR